MNYLRFIIVYNLYCIIYCKLYIENLVQYVASQNITFNTHIFFFLPSHPENILAVHKTVSSNYFLKINK